MIGWTMCSGIGAPEAAARWVDWRLASEVELFPRAVLAARYGYREPDDHNQGEPLLWGDMTEVTPALARARGVPLPDILVAGTPCQAFSVAGLRRGLDDDRGNLTLRFVEACHDIAAARPDGRLAVLWENVPGVLSDTGNAFGCFLGGLVGAVHPLRAPGNGSWPGEGMVQGPRARAAWSVLDAQWFGVAQRRRRVFVVVDFGGACDPAAVLLEPDRLRGNSPPSREAGQAAPTIPARSTGGGGLGTDFDCDGGLIAKALTAHPSRSDGETETFITHALRGEGFDASEDGTGRGTPLVPMAFMSNASGANMSVGADCSPTLRIGGDGGNAMAVAFDTTQITSPGNYSAPKPSDPAHPLAAGAHPPAIAIQERAGAEVGQGPGGKGWRDDGAAYTLEARHHVQSVATPCAVRRLTPVECERLQGFPDDHTAIPWRGKPADSCPDGPRYKALGNSMAVPCVAWIMDRLRLSMEAAP